MNLFNQNFACSANEIDNPSKEQRIQLATVEFGRLLTKMYLDENTNIFQCFGNIYLQKTGCLYTKTFFQDLICSTSPMK